MRKEIAAWTNRPGITGLFTKHVSRQVPRHDYNPNADYHWIKHESRLGYLPLAIELPLEIVKQEADRAEAEMTELAVGDDDSWGWTNFGLFSDNTNNPHRAGIDSNPDEARWQPRAEELMPETVRWFREEWPHARMHKLRLLGLEPGGVIGMHNDDCHGLLNINIAIRHPLECQFYLEHWGRLPFQDGAVFATDVGYNHAVINGGDQRRLHLVLYQEDDDRFQQLLVRSYHLHYGGRDA